VPGAVSHPALTAPCAISEGCWSGDDDVDGNGSANTLLGGGDGDVLIGGNADDLFVFDDGDGDDTVNDFVAGNLTDDVLDLTAFRCANV